MIGLIPFLIIGLVFSEVYLKKNNDISQENETNQVSVETTIETKPPEIKLEPEVVEIKEEKPPEEPQEEVCEFPTNQRKGSTLLLWVGN